MDFRFMIYHNIANAHLVKFVMIYMYYGSPEDMKYITGTDSLYLNLRIKVSNIGLILMKIDYI